MSQPRKHHYLPQFYLRGFSSDRRAIYQIEKKNGRHYGCQIKDVAAIRDYHAIDADDATDPYSLEKQLAKLEGVLAKSLDRVLADGIINKAIRSDLMLFVAHLRLRVPAVKTHIEHSLKSQIRAAAKIMERQGKLQKLPPGLEEVLCADNLVIQICNWKCLDIMFEMAATPDFLNVLAGMRATIYRTSFDNAFVTSDQPVALYHSGIGLSKDAAAGPATPGIEITLPLSNRVLLKLDHEYGNDIKCDANSTDVREFNRRTVIMAQDFVFAGERPDFVADFMHKFSSLSAGFRHESIKIENGFFLINRCLPVLPDNMPY